ncbi:hypothetical protein ACT7C4_23890 [Bacillus pacificus]
METKKNNQIGYKKHSLHGKIIAVSVRHWNAKEDYIKKVSDSFKKN